MTSATLRFQLEDSLADRIPAAFSRKTCTLPELLPSGIVQVDELLGGGVPRGGFTEISGPASSGRTALALSIIARTSAENSCAWVDVHDALDPESAAACGIRLEHLLWLRMGGKGKVVRKTHNHKVHNTEKPWTRLDQALKATDLLLQAGGFCAIVLDMSDVRAEDALRVPLASWYRFRLAAAQAQTALILLSQIGCAKSSASLALRCSYQKGNEWQQGIQVLLFEKTCYAIAIERKRGEAESVFARKKTPQSSGATWAGETLWAESVRF